MIRYRIVHTTRYSFDAPVASYSLELRLRPRDMPAQQLGFHQLVVRPHAKVFEEYDTFDNHVARVVSSEELRSLELHAISEVLLGPAPPEPEDPVSWESVRDELNRRDDGSLRQLATPREEMASPAAIESARAYAESSFVENRSMLQAIDDLASRMRADFREDPAAVIDAPSLARVLQTRRGVCQDRARAGIACLRSLGLAARYVGGYRIESTRGELHAWCSAWLPDRGWMDFDPSGDPASGARILVGHAADAADLTPVRGLFHGGGRQQQESKVIVERL